MKKKDSRPLFLRKRALPLQRRVQYFTFTYSMFLLVVLSCCIGLLYQNTEVSRRLLEESYLQSGALSQISDTNRMLAEYGAYPDIMKQDEIRKALTEGSRLILNLPEKQDRNSREGRMLTTAIRRTYESMEESAENLFDMPVSDQPEQEFYVRYYETLEIGNYVDAYLKQLTTETLAGSYSAYEWQKNFFRRAILALTLFAVIMGAAMLQMNQWFSRRVVRPIFALADAANIMAKNRMDIPDLPVEQGDELGELTLIFNKMKKDCQTLLVTQQKLSESRIAMLRQQINPHFLFNTLSLIANVAAEEEAIQAGELIRRLSLLLRRTIYTREEWVPLRQELETLNSYIYIQKMRFSDRILFWTDCRVPPGEYKVPAFLLQPLVENSISHGLREREEGGVIRVKIVRKKNGLSITVTDNGAGISRETLERLRRGEYDINAKSSGVGVLNVAERIRLLDPESRFRIYSRRGMGTSIRIDLRLEEVTE